MIMEKVLKCLFYEVGTLKKCAWYFHICPHFISLREKEKLKMRVYYKLGKVRNRKSSNFLHSKIHIFHTMTFEDIRMDITLLI